MTLRLKLSARAKRDLADIKSHIAQRNPPAAERVRQRIQQTITILRDHPYIGRPTLKPGVLMTTVPRYRYKIYFAVAGDELRTIHIRHGARHDPKPHELQPNQLTRGARGREGERCLTLWV